MDGVGISIIERPRPLPGHDTPNPTQHPYTLKCEEPQKAPRMYYYADTKKTQKVYIGYIGYHPTNTKTN